MMKRGKAPYLECSTVGSSVGRLFSAFVARVRNRGNQTIEQVYQASKIFEDGSTGLHWREAKGRKATNQEACAALYKVLWKEYLNENPQLWIHLERAEGLSDAFGQEDSVCQADTLWTLREERLATK